jgi:hypothetical protein
MRHIFDENFPALAMQAIRQKVASVVQIGQDWGESGWLDVEQILPHLHGLKVTFHTLDAGLFKRRYAHSSYCLVYYDVPEEILGTFVIKFLRHHSFKTHAQRLGRVIKVSPSKIAYCEFHRPQIKKIDWMSPT